MDFKAFNIPAKGRSNYGQGLYAISKGYATIGEFKYKNDDNDITINDPDNNQGSFYLFLSRASGDFDYSKIEIEPQTDTINVIGYQGMTMCDTYVGDISSETAKANNGIYGLPEQGITVTVGNNGTTGTTISFKVDDKIESETGIIYIPVNIYTKNTDGIGDDFNEWYSIKDDCVSLVLEYTYRVSFVKLENHYTLEISNENASINCDADGNILAGATRPTCQAELYLGQTKVADAAYGFSTPEDKEAQGITIDTSTGILTFGSNFTFKGTTLEVKITATVNGVTVFKIMSISKQYAGADGTPATSRWVVPSHNAITYNPNNATISPSSITCKCMKQVGEESPVEDTATQIYYGYDTSNPLTKYTAAISPDVSKSYLVFGIKNAAGEIYEIETIQIIKEGKDGSNGQDGTDGKDGTNGESVYRLDLTNDNAGINCDADGNIYATAYRPKCTATLYYGTQKVSNAVYSISTSVNTTGLTIASSTGVLTFGSTFNFDKSTTTLEITVNAKINNVLYGSAIMTVSRNYAGKDGADGQNGQDGKDGLNGADGVNGQDGKDGADGVSIVWKGSSITHPANPQNGWAYYNTGQKKSFIYQDGAWYQMTIDGTDGQDGQDGKDGQDGQDGSNGLSIVWKGDLATAPANPEVNWCYRDTDNGKVYIYNGLAWELMVLDGSDGEDGADGQDGKDGLSVFITYHDNAITSTPANPTGNGTTGGWHTNATKAANWMSQKVASAATAGTWGAPIQICGANGQDGQDGSDGADGSDGQDAVTYWLEFSADAFQVNSGGTVSPSTFTIQAMKQVGGDTPVNVTPSATGGTIQIKYGHNTVVPSTQYKSGQTITVDGTKNYITVQLYVDGTKIDTETLPILHDGKNGSNGTNGKDGADGRQGPAVRGPVDWRDQTTSRRWCNGTLTNASYPEDAQFLDIVVFDGTYYQCKTSYNGKGGTTAPSSTYWTAVDSQYKFVATDLLLAQNAKINFQSSNEIYLMDDNGNVTAGAAGGNGVSFWAGANEPENGNFKVDYNGNMTAKTGTFAGYIQMPYVRTSTLMQGEYCVPGTTAYLLVDSGFYGMGDGCMIKLPEPTAALNGFTYHIIAASNIATKGVSGVYGVSKYGFNHSVTIQTTNKSKKLMQNVFWSDVSTKYDTLAFYTGTIVITCVPSFYSTSEYVWVVTQCQDVDCFNGYDIINTFSTVISNNTVEKVYYVDALPSTKEHNAVYFVK